MSDFQLMLDTNWSVQYLITTFLTCRHVHQRSGQYVINLSVQHLMTKFLTHCHTN